MFRALPPRKWKRASLGLWPRPHGLPASLYNSPFCLSLFSSTVLLDQGGWEGDMAISLACFWEKSSLQAYYLVTVVQFLSTSVPICATVGWHLSWGHFICHLWCPVGTQANHSQMACGQNCWKTESLRQSPSILLLTTGIWSQHPSAW